MYMKFARYNLKNDKLNINEFYLATYINLKKGGKSTIQKKAALHYAIEKENIDIIKLLLENEKIDINIISLSGAIEYVEKTPLIIAVELENIEIIEILLENKNIDIDYHSQFCKTALQIATEKKNDTIVNLLSTKENKT